MKEMGEHMQNQRQNYSKSQSKHKRLEAAPVVQVGRGDERDKESD